MKSRREEQRTQARAARTAHVEAWRGSGLTQSAYCAEQGLRPTTFSHWIHKRPDGAREAKLSSPAKGPKTGQGRTLGHGAPPERLFTVIPLRVQSRADSAKREPSNNGSIIPVKSEAQKTPQSVAMLRVGGGRTIEIFLGLDTQSAVAVAALVHALDTQTDRAHYRHHGDRSDGGDGSEGSDGGDGSDQADQVNQGSAWS